MSSLKAQRKENYDKCRLGLAMATHMDAAFCSILFSRMPPPLNWTQDLVYSGQALSCPSLQFSSWCPFPYSESYVFHLTPCHYSWNSKNMFCFLRGVWECSKENHSITPVKHVICPAGAEGTGLWSPRDLSLNISSGSFSLEEVSQFCLIAIITVPNAFRNNVPSAWASITFFSFPLQLTFF